VIVLDTHTFVWWVQGDRRLSRAAMAAIARARDLIVPDIVLWEIAMHAADRRIRFNDTTATWLKRATQLPGVRTYPINAEIAVAAVAINQVSHGDPADGLIAATALRLGLPLVTRDGRLRALPAIETIW
jgi:PIN domain nuclease of toxin-antitoxin system